MGKPAASRGRGASVAFGKRREPALMIFRRKDGAVNRYNLALLLLTLAVIPLFDASIWSGAIALVAAYGLVARLANRDFDRQHRKGSGPPRPCGFADDSALNFPRRQQGVESQRDGHGGDTWRS